MKIASSNCNACIYNHSETLRVGMEFLPLSDLFLLVSACTGHVSLIFFIKALSVSTRTTPVSLGFAIAIVTMSQSFGCNRVLNIFIEENYWPM